MSIAPWGPFGPIYNIRGTFAGFGDPNEQKPKRKKRATPRRRVGDKVRNAVEKVMRKKGL